MKKSLVLVLTFVMVFAFTTSAFAQWGGGDPGHNPRLSDVGFVSIPATPGVGGNPTIADLETDYGYMGVQWANLNYANATSIGTRLENLVAGSGFTRTQLGIGGGGRETSSYLSWDDPRVVDGGVATPHAGYQQTTTKCAVCHSVHFAPIGTDAGANGRTSAAAYAGADKSAEMLLRTSVGNSCSFCHIETNIGGVAIYGGQVDWFGTSQQFNSVFAHDFHDAGCLDCHSVHGAGTFQGASTASILLLNPRGRTAQPGVYGVSATDGSGNTEGPWNGIFDNEDDARDYAADRYLQQVAFCTACHWTYAEDSAQDVIRRGGGSWSRMHPLVEATTDASDPANWTTSRTGASAAASAVEWSSSDATTCRSCHDAGTNPRVADVGSTGGAFPTGFTTSNFPHYTAGDYRFLDQNQSGAEYKTDVSCIKCHDNVGVDY